MPFLARVAAIALASVIASTASAETPRALTLDDHSRFVAVGDPQRSPDGVWVAYGVTTIDPDKDKRDADVWTVRWDGTDHIRLTRNLWIKVSHPFFKADKIKTPTLFLGGKKDFKHLSLNDTVR